MAFSVSVQYRFLNCGFGSSLKTYAYKFWLKNVSTDTLQEQLGPTVFNNVTWWIQMLGFSLSGQDAFYVHSKRGTSALNLEAMQQVGRLQSKIKFLHCIGFQYRCVFLNSAFKTATCLQQCSCYAKLTACFSKSWMVWFTKTQTKLTFSFPYTPKSIG